MKVAMIGHKHIPSREGGVEIAVEEISKHLVKKGYKVDAYNRKAIHKKSEKIPEHKHYYKGIKIIEIPTIDNKSLDALIYSFLATLKVLFGKYDVIHYHAEGPCVMLIIPHLFKIRTVATIHGLDWQRAKWGKLAIAYILLGEKIAAKYADEIIVLSRNAQDYFIKTYDRSTHYIPNGVNLPRSIEAEVIKKKYDLDKNDYFLFLARIVPEKGLHYLLEAYQNLNTNIKLVIAGGSSHTDEYMEKIKSLAEKDNRIIMSGFVNGKELEELFSNCRAYILPSDIEGMPLSLLEAMSYGRKCIVSNIKENMEVIQNDGYIFEKGDAESLLHQLEIVLSEEDNDDPGNYSNYNLSKYNWEIITEKYTRLYTNAWRERMMH